MDGNGFKRELLEFQEACREHHERGRKLFALLENDQLSKLVEKPFLLNMVFEKYLDLLNDRLVPALQLNEQAAESVRSEPLSRAAGGANVPPQRPIARGPQAAPPANGSSGGGFAEKPSPVKRVEPIQQVQRPAQAQPAAKAAPVAGAAPAGKTQMTLNTDDEQGRRLIPRYNCRLPVRYSVLGRDKVMNAAYSRDVGARGLFIMANRPEKVGNSLNIEVEMPETGLVKIQAVVAWTKWVPQNLRSVDYSGFGVKITTATENWYRYFMSIQDHMNPADRV